MLVLKHVAQIVLVFGTVPIVSLMLVKHMMILPSAQLEQNVSGIVQKQQNAPMMFVILIKQMLHVHQM
jgi:hypothetical protein